MLRLFSLVRDYCISTFQPADLRALQRAFVIEVINTKEKWDQSAVGSTIPKGKEVDWFVVTHALQFHMVSAWTEPLRNDSQACGWLLHRSYAVRRSAALALELEEVRRLGEEFTHEGEHGLAAQIYDTIVRSFMLPMERRVGFVKKCWSALDQINRLKDQKYSNIDVHVSGHVYASGKIGSADWLAAFDRLRSMVERGEELNPLTSASVLIMLG
jgi:hypothetical protein